MIWSVLGVIGVVVTVGAYGLLSSGKFRADDLRYQWMNVAGTTGILFSLIGQWNLPAFIANVAWISIGVVGLVRIYRRRGTHE